MTKVEVSSSFERKILVISSVVLIATLSVGYFVYKRPKPPQEPSKELTYWPVSVFGHDINYLQTVESVFDRLGHRKVNGSEEAWDILWSFEFPFENRNRFKDLKPHQLINHFPGMTFLSNKMFLAVSTQSKYLPIAFDFPRLKNEFLYYLKINPEKQYIQKSYDHGGMNIVSFDEIDFLMGEQDYIQEFITNPLLIDGRAFDFGVYVLISSMEPLRIYRWKSDITLRFFSEPYHPFDPKVQAKFNAWNNHLHYWDLPSMNHSEKLDFSAQEALNHLLLEREADLTKIWDQVDDAIVSITLSKSAQISRYTKMFQRAFYGRRGGLFELLRFDFIIDDKMKVYLMEANMSPNLTPYSEREKLLFEQLIHNTITLMGGTRRSEIEPVCVGNENLCSSSMSTEEVLSDSKMLSASKDIAVNFEECLNCNQTCDDDACSLCVSCLSESTILDFLRSHREHQRRGQMRRLFPSDLYMQDKILKRLSEPNRLSLQWFKAKCDNDLDWC